MPQVEHRENFFQVIFCFHWFVLILRILLLYQRNLRIALLQLDFLFVDQMEIFFPNIYIFF